MRISKSLRAAIKLSEHRAYQIAHHAEVHPNVLSALINGIIPVRENDPRVLRIAQVVGITPEQAFEAVPEDSEVVPRTRGAE